MNERYVSICEHIQPKDILHYLSRFGTVEKIGNYRDTSSVYAVASNRFLIPNHTNFDDYAMSVGEIVKKISIIENRPFDDILETLELASLDILSFRNMNEDTADGTIPLWQCQKFVQGATDMVSAIACSASNQKRSYSGKKPQEAEEFFRKIKFGQTKIGSFIINLRCPIEQEFAPDLFGNEPYSNCVLPLLDKALTASFEFAREAMVKDDISELIAHPEAGLSSNFFDALAQLYESSGNGKFEISTSPAINRKRPFFPKKHTFNSEFIDCFRAASKQIKETEPLQDQTVCGPVIHIDQNPESEFKSVTIRDIKADKPRDVLICLKDEDYDQYFQNFREGIFRVVGTLNVARGKKSKIMDYSILEIVNSNSDECSDF